MAAIALRSNRSLCSTLPRMAYSAAWRPFQGSDTTSRLIRRQSFCQHVFDLEMSSTKPASPKFLFPNGPNSLGFAPGIYKAILIGKVGQAPLVKILPNGSEVVSFALGTGGLRNNRRAREDESAEAYAERSFTQWHKVCVFRQSILSLAKQITKGMNVYVEGSIETRVFTDKITGTLKRVREISIRQNGRLYIMGSKPLLAAEVAAGMDH